MNGKILHPWWTFGFALLATTVLTTNSARAHCDGMDGPVVKAARAALATGNVNRALIWVHAEDEPAIRQAFEKTLALRNLSGEARELADLWLFETLVRIHRAGEGAPYTGLKPAGRDLGPVIPAADKAIAEGSVERLLKLLPPATHDAVRVHFRRLMAKKDYKADDVPAGREYVAEYVAFMHAVEHLHAGAEHHAAGPRHGADSDAQPVAGIPRPLKVEHEALHKTLLQATNEGGKTGAAARSVAEALHRHFVKEEQLALPPLGLLAPLAQGKPVREPARVFSLTDKLEAELPRMLKEHQAIVAALDKLIQAAKEEQKPQYVRFAEKLKLHAETEEQVLYPAAILVGKYLALKHGH